MVNLQMVNGCGAHARSTHLQRYKFYTSSALSPDAPAVAYGLAYTGNLAATVHVAQSSPASCPSTELPPYLRDVVVMKVYPLITVESLSNVVSRKVSLIIPEVFILMKSSAKLRV